MRDWSNDYRESDAWVERLPSKLTASGAGFVEQHLRDLLYFTRDLQLLETLDDAATVVDRALSDEAATRTPLRNRLRAMGVWLTAEDLDLDTPRGELILTRYIDSYLTYLSEVLHEALLVRPEILSSGEQMTLKDALAHETMEQLVIFLADRKVSRLSFKGLGELEDYFVERLGMPLVEDDRLADYLREWVALRNLLTHRRGIVDQRALTGGLPAEHYSVGERVQISRAGAFRILAAVVAGVLDLDRRIAAKFSLKLVATPHSDSHTPRGDASPEAELPRGAT